MLFQLANVWTKAADFVENYRLIIFMTLIVMCIAIAAIIIYRYSKPNTMEKSKDNIESTVDEQARIKQQEMAAKNNDK